MNTISTAIIGKGALGLLYADIITTHNPTNNIFFVMDKKRFERHRNEQVVINDEPREFKTVVVDEAPRVDLVIVATKTTGLKQALDLIEPLLNPNTIIVSVLNGITSEEHLASRYGWDHVVPCVAQGMDAMRFGSTMTYTKQGELHIGRFEQTPADVYTTLCTYFDHLGIPYMEEADIRYRLWAKFLLNVGLNQTCAAYNCTYSDVLQEGETNRVMIAAMREVLALAQAEQVGLTEQELNHMVSLIGTLDPQATPSMGQDRINHNYSEVDEFSGEVIRRAETYGILVPTNRYLNVCIKTIEETY